MRIIPEIMSTTYANNEALARKYNAVSNFIRSTNKRIIVEHGVSNFEITELSYHETDGKDYILIIWGNNVTSIYNPKQIKIDRKFHSIELYDKFDLKRF